METKIDELIKQRVELELVGSQESLDMKILSVVNFAASKGMLGSGSTVIKMCDAFKEEARQRIGAIWEIIHRVITSANVKIDDESSSEIKELLESLADKHTNTLPAYYIERISKHLNGIEGFIQEKSDEIEAAISNELHIQINELEIFTINYQTTSQASGAPVIYNYSTIGSIQTAPHAVATVNIQFNSAAELREVLEQIDRDLNSLEGYSEPKKQELKEVITDGLTELEKPDPNKARLRGTLRALIDGFNQVDAAFAGAEKVHGWGLKLAGALDSIGGFLSS